MSTLALDAPGRPPARWLRQGAIALIRAYQLVFSPLLAPSCRFDPNCSTYAAEAIERHGLFRGIWLAATRIGRCHPWGGFGHDPVP